MIVRLKKFKKCGKVHFFKKLLGYTFPSTIHVVDLHRMYHMKLGSYFILLEVWNGEFSCNLGDLESVHKRDPEEFCAEFQLDLKFSIGGSVGIEVPSHLDRHHIIHARKLSKRVLFQLVFV